MELIKDAVPVIESPRKFPIKVRREIKAEVNKLLKEGIIRNVDKATEWAATMVLIRKPTRSRLCIAPKRLNESLVRNRYITPTVE